MAEDFYTYRGDIRPFGNGSPISYLPDPTLTDLSSGEFCAWNATSQTLVRFHRAGGQGRFIGVSRDSQKGLAKLGNQPALAAATGAVGRVSVFSSGIHELFGTAAETYVHGTAVYMSGTDTQKVTTVAGVPAGVSVGTVHLPDGSTKTGAVRVPVLIDESTITQV